MSFKVWPIVLLASSLPLGAARAQDDGTPSYTIEDVTACSKDAVRLCRNKIGNLSEIEACMRANYANLSPKCQARFNR